MHVTVYSEHRFARTSDGAVWGFLLYGHPFWKRYLDVFETVKVVARVVEVDKASSGSVRADGPRVHFEAVPHYIGPSQYLHVRSEVKAAIRHSIEPNRAHILRVPGRIGSLAARQLHHLGMSFGLEIVGDPHDAFSKGASVHPFRSVFQRLYTANLRFECNEAIATAYVTREALQRRYPPHPSAFTTHYSSIELTSADYVRQPRQEGTFASPLRLVFVGSLEHLQKAPDVLLRAVSQCRDAGVDFDLKVIGGGALGSTLEEIASDLNILDRVQFLGALPAGVAIREQLDSSDIFVLPSRQEGLPRAMIEAMARGLPCIGSNVAGIPELLPPEDLVTPGDISALRNRLLHFSANRTQLPEKSARNLAVAGAYEITQLRQRRVAMYEYMLEHGH